MSFRPLPLLARFYVYGLHGLAAEILYTAAWHLIFDYNYKLQGYSHVAAFFIYGLAILVIEQFYLALRQRLTMLLRVAVYVCVCYTLEFTAGLTLKYLGVCPWDYEPWFNYHVYGVITFEYVPVWFVATLFAERVIIQWAQKLHLVEQGVVGEIKEQQQVLLVEQSTATTTTNGTLCHHPHDD